MSSYEWMELQTLTAEIAASRARLVQARSTRDVGRVRALEEEISAAEARRDRLLAHITTNLVATPDPPPRGRGRGANAAQNAASEPTALAEDASGSTADDMLALAERLQAEAESTLPSDDQNRSDAADTTEEAAPAEQPAETDDPPAVEAEAIEASGVTAPGADDAASAEPEPDPKALAAEAAEPAATAEPTAAAVNDELKSPPPNGRVVASDAATPAPALKISGAQGGINVWDQLKPSDIERAKQDLETRREEMLTRHAEELRGLEADRAQLDTLEQAIAMFVQKFSGANGDVVALDAEREARQQA